VQRITIEEMRAVYLQQILGGHERLAEFIANRWLFRNMDIYRFFEESLEKISPEFEKITELPADQAEALLKEACEKFGCEKTFCFVAINDVVLPKPLFERLQRQALEHLSVRQKDEPADEQEEAEARLRAEMDRLKERHEKKIAEMTKKHQQEVQRLQKEISQLKAECLNMRTARSVSRG